MITSTDSLEERTRRVNHVVDNDQATRHMGFTIESVTAEGVTLSMTIEPHHTNGVGICHGGVLFTLADSATGLAANSHDHTNPWVTRTATMSFIAPARLGATLTATASLTEIEHERRRTFVAIIRGEAGEIARLDSSLSLLPAERANRDA